MPKLDDTPEKLAPYLQHGVRLTWRHSTEVSGEANGDCPFCGKENHFFVNKETGQYNCKVCSAGEGDKPGGNLYNFLRKLHQESVLSTSDAELDMVAEERKITTTTLKRWGLVQSCIDREWMLPTYGVKGITNLYRWSKRDGKRKLLATKGLPQGLFGTQLGGTNDKKDIYLCEGPWDAMVLEEVLSMYRINGGKLIATGDPNLSIKASCHVWAAPGCNVFKEEWVPLFSNRTVHLLYDNDHPKVHPRTGKEQLPVGYNGMRSAARKLLQGKAIINYIHWGDSVVNV